jgi:hypothetical protein
VLLVTSSAFLKEAIVLAGRNRQKLRRLALLAGMKQSRIDAVNVLCNGQHPANEFLVRARRKLGFHWDDDVVGPSVSEFGTNKKIIWIESDAQGHPVHALAFSVLANALFPKVAVERDPEVAETETSRTMDDIRDAMRLITEFFTASVYGYIRERGDIRVRRWRSTKGGA